eukprot:GHVN01017605.1.p1 GENE.GHVN01017605.1~~GHVN01017605.1.p1  ORF type:complete len:395 (+),score=85.05 GHVN01017605.1:199-1383(+)
MALQSPFWDHYQNFHRELHQATKGETEAFQAFFKKKVCITEKLDGSNLGIHLSRGDKSKQWEVEALIGRSTLLWKAGGGTKAIDKLPSYGNAGRLGELPFAMRDFAAKVGDALGGETDIVVFGEAFRFGKDQPLASWHPFGVKLPPNGEVKENDDPDFDGWNLLRLTKSLHEIFQSSSVVEQPKDHASLFSLLGEGKKNHVVCPPPLMYANHLGEAVDFLHEVLISNAMDRTFEGLFTVMEDNSLGFKWKTGTFDEQASIPSIEDFDFSDHEQIQQEVEWYAKLSQVYHTRAPLDVKKEATKPDKGKAVSPAEQELINYITKAFEREQSKMTSIGATPKKERKALVELMLPAVVKEVELQFEEAGQQTLFTHEQLKKKASTVVTQKVMNVPVDE